MYNELGQPDSTYVTSSTTEGVELHRRFYYGLVSDTDVFANNMVQQLREVWDSAGIVLFPNYDFKGSPLLQIRTFLENPYGRTDWTNGPGTGVDTVHLETETLSAATVYDALGRARYLFGPDGCFTVYVYNAGGMPYSTEVGDVG